MIDKKIVVRAHFKEVDWITQLWSVIAKQCFLPLVVGKGMEVVVIVNLICSMCKLNLKPTILRQL